MKAHVSSIIINRNPQVIPSNVSAVNDPQGVKGPTAILRFGMEVLGRVSAFTNSSTEIAQHSGPTKTMSSVILLELLEVLLSH